MPRPIAGQLTYTDPPEPGTIIGPRGLTGEWLVVLESDLLPGTPIGYATEDELRAASARDPQSVPEAHAKGVRRATNPR
jgi:hypothetical protein